MNQAGWAVLGFRLGESWLMRDWICFGLRAASEKPFSATLLGMP